MNKTDYIFTHIITDEEDFLGQLIGLSEKTKEILFWNIGYRGGVSFMNCLRKHYTNEEIMELFNTIDTHTVESNIVQNTMELFKFLPLSLVYDKFKKVNNNFSELYDEFSRLKGMEEDWLKENPQKTLTFSVNNVDYVPDGII